MKTWRSEKNRTQRKARWIRAKNLMRMYPDCAYNGDFYCNHIYDSQYPWCWVDFRFFHTTKRMYFAVMMKTAEYEAYNKRENEAWEFTEAQFPPRDYLFAGHDVLCFDEQDEQVHDCFRQKRDELLKLPTPAKPLIETMDYGRVTVGVNAVVNTQQINQHVIRDFISFFRSLGEPTRPGLIWEGQEQTFIPAQLDERYSSQRSNS